MSFILYYQLISKNACAKIRLDESISSIQLAFDKYMWNIKLHWRSGNVFFDSEWLCFVKAAKLCVRNICVIQKTMDPRKFKVAILEKKNVSNFNTLGKF